MLCCGPSRVAEEGGMPACCYPTHAEEGGSDVVLLPDSRGTEKGGMPACCCRTQVDLLGWQRRCAVTRLQRC